MADLKSKEDALKDFQEQLQAAQQVNESLEKKILQKESEIFKSCEESQDVKKQNQDKEENMFDSVIEISKKDSELKELHSTVDSLQMKLASLESIDIERKRELESIKTENQNLSKVS